MFRLNIRKFLKRTCLPGFSEIYNAENRFWRIFWFVIVAFSFGMTGYLLVNATLVQFINQPTTTSILTATTEDLLYLPFRMCYPHWMYWVEFEKALKMNFTKYGMLYGLSYLTKIYVSTKINETEAKENFHTQMAANNLSTVMDFYKAIATDQEVFRNSRMEPLVELTQIELYYDDITQRSYLCQTITKENIQRLLTDKTNSNWNHVDRRIGTRRNDLIFQLSYDSVADYTKYIDDLEYTSYVFDVFEGRINFTGISGANSTLPFLLYPTSYDDDRIILPRDVDTLRITIKAAINLWKSTNQSPCQENLQWVTTNNTCMSECFKKKLVATINVHSEIPVPINHAVLINNYSVNISTNDIVYLGKHGGESATVETIPENIDGQPIAWTLSHQLQDQLAEECETSCEGVKGCQEYMLDINQEQTAFVGLSGTSGFRCVTMVTVKYPKETEILVTKQEDAKTWQDFIGNVGGLLGIWTGASVVAFVQLFYLCCCSSSSKSESSEKSTTRIPAENTHL